MSLQDWITETGNSLDALGKRADDVKASFDAQATAAFELRTRTEEAAAATEEAAQRTKAAADEVSTTVEQAGSRVSSFLAATRKGLAEATGGFAGFAADLLRLAAEGGPLSKLRAASRDTRTEVDEETKLLGSLLAEARSAGQAELQALQRDVERGRVSIEQILENLKSSTDNAAQAALLAFDTFDQRADTSAEAVREIIKSIELLQRETEPGSKTFANLQALLDLLSRINAEKSEVEE